jgi:hypothetical protein
MFRNSLRRGRSPSARGHVTRISLFHLIPAVIPLIPGTIAPYKFKNLYSHFVFLFKPLFYCMVLFEASFGISVKLLS